MSTRVFDYVVRRPLETALLLAAMVFLLLAIGATAWVAIRGSDDTHDLNFAGTVNELSRVLSVNGPERFGSLEPATVALGANSTRVDTIVIAADTIVEPALQTGGFLRDQVALYNDHVVRNAFLGLSDPARRTTRGAEGPSLLRTVLTEDGARRLSTSPNAYVMTVRSPRAERNWREVRTEDWSRRMGFLGLEGDVPLGRGMPDRSIARLNGRECTIRNQDPKMLIYCSSALASDAGKFYDFGVDLADGESGASIPSAYTYRRRGVWRNGRSENLETYPVSAGDLFDTRYLGPFVISTSDHGTLAAGQWINGRESFLNQRLGTISFFAAAGRASGEGNGAPLVLSLDAALSADMEREARAFMEAQEGRLARMSVVLMDMRNGEVKAIVEPQREAVDDPLLAYEPLLIGSVVKPMIASAILARQPQLANLRVEYAGDTVRTLRGLPLRRGFANAANGCAGTIDLNAFLRCSSNQYAAELLLRSLQQDGFNAQAGSAEAVIPREVLEASSIGTGLAEAFDVDAFGERTAGRNPMLTSGADVSRILDPWESRPWILFPESEGTRVDLLARYAFGGWENRWTLLGVAEAYARIATGREVAATIFARPDSAPRASPAHVAAAFARVRGPLREVSASGTAHGLDAAIRNATQNQAAVLAKTGTLNEETGRFKSLALAVGLPAGETASAALRCGLAAVTYFEFADDFRPHSTQALPPVHLEFAGAGLAEVIGKHWARVSGCTAPAANTKAMR
jgi:hypothetical protein